MTYKLAKDIRPGDRIIVGSYSPSIRMDSDGNEIKDAGRTVTVRAVSKGWITHSTMISWKDGWSCPDNDDQLVLAE